MLFLPSDDDPRVSHLTRCIAESVEAGGGVVTDDPALAALRLTVFRGPEDAERIGPGENVAYYYSPRIPPHEWYEALSKFDRVLVASPPLRDEMLPNLEVPVELAVPPVRLTPMPGAPPYKAMWATKKDTDYRVYTVVPPHEAGCVYPLVLAFLDEYRNTDDVSLNIRALGDRGAVEDAVGYAVDEIGLPKSKQARVRIVVGPWRHGEQLDLAGYGDCCLLPWAGSWMPLEAAYGLAAGNFVAATNLSAGGLLTPRNGTRLDYTLDPGGFAVLDWTQVAAVLRIAVAGGRRERVPAKASVGPVLCESGHFSRILMAKPASAPD